jgi:hypothetical protein
MKLLKWLPCNTGESLCMSGLMSDYASVMNNNNKQTPHTGAGS